MAGGSAGGTSAALPSMKNCNVRLQVLAPPESWQDINFHLVMKCMDACKDRAHECKAARDLRLTEKRIDEEKGFLVNEDKKAEIKSGYIEKKLAAARAAAAKATGVEAVAVDMQQLASEADAKVAEVLRGKQAAIEKYQSSLPQKIKDVAASAEVKLWACVERVWKACGCAAIQEEFQILDRCSSNSAPRACASCSICHPAHIQISTYATTGNSLSPSPILPLLLLSVKLALIAWHEAAALRAIVPSAWLQ
jgi:hypothetical protein